MTRRFLLLVLGSVLAVSFATPLPHPTAAGRGNLPARLTDDQFWKLVTDFSEPDGHFRSDNLLSNEIFLQHVIPDLVRTARHDRVYLGVGPEQNFTYISALRPSLAFIVDVRRGNLQLHLMYKALFELAADRAEFVSRLFAKERPPGLGPESSVQEIFSAFARVDTSDAVFQANLREIRNHLVRTRSLGLDADDLKGIEYVYYQFYWYGPIIQYWSTSGRPGAQNAPTYVDLMLAEDGRGQGRSFLATEDSFRFLKQLHTDNLLVPIVGNFAGPKALRSVGRFLREHRAVVSAFYLSNVEQYLSRDGLLMAFCGNVALLPLDDTSTFIRSVRTGTYGSGVGLESRLGSMATEVRTCAAR
ncbi:MAG TPA: hypothetical protein VD833_17715 [Vicinamibacterales bacterium]|nr:hypothetical protein [Vicinamibacterales bacterium]